MQQKQSELKPYSYHFTTITNPQTTNLSALH
jgi:hypothetical protein